MKLKFKATPWLKSYEATDVKAYDRDIVDVAPHRGMQLMKTWPQNFKSLEPSSPKPPTLTKLTSTPLVSILIPQRGRPAKIKRCLELIVANTNYPNYEVILICDRDDLASVGEIPKHKRIKVVVDPSPKKQMFVGKANYGFRISKAPYLVYLANDVEVGKNWLTEAMKTMLETFPGGVGLVGFNHGDPQKHAYHGLISRGFVNKYLKGNIFYPGYIHFWCDLELVAIAKKYNRFRFCSRAKVYHRSVKDNIHAEGWRASYHQGANLLIKRSKENFPL